MHSAPRPHAVHHAGRLFLGAAGLLLFLTACQAVATSTPTSPPSTIHIGFADSAHTLMDSALPIFTDEYPALDLVSSAGSSMRILEDLLAGDLDAAILPCKPELMLGYRQLDDSEAFWTAPLAWDGLALVVNPDNPLTGLTLAEAQAVYRGQTWSWDMIGGVPAAIEVVIREEGSGTRELFQQMVMAEHRITLTAVVIADDQAIINYVNSHAQAIGFVPAAAADDRVKTLALEGHYPTTENLAGQSYELAYPVYFVSINEPDGELRQLPIWLSSRDGQAVLGRHYGQLR